MLFVNTILGNIYKDDQLAKKIEDSKEQGKFRRLSLSRIEMEKTRLRKKTDDGFDIGFVLEPGTKLQHGDVISESDEIILIELLPEKTLVVKFKENRKDLFLLVGHIIGNRHRPLSIASDGSILFPIHDETEIELFKQLFSDIIDHLSLHVEDEIFVPNEGMNVHEH